MLLVYWCDSGDILVFLKWTQSRYGHMPGMVTCQNWHTVTFLTETLILHQEPGGNDRRIKFLIYLGL